MCRSFIGFSYLLHSPNAYVVNWFLGFVAKIQECAIAAPRTKSQRQIASPTSSSITCSWASGSPLLTHLARPFRIMWTASIPCDVRHAVENDWYPLASQTRFFETRWSCSTTLFKYLHWRRRQRRRSVPSTLSSSRAAGYARFLSTLITLGCGLAG